jgi:predicted LPLAT superfamily acyltransferase
MIGVRTRRDGEGRSWLAIPERGSRLALGSVVWCFRRFGDSSLRPLLGPIAAYYSVFGVGARRASREYLARLDRAGARRDRRRSLRDTYRHFRSFAEVILDRFCFWTGARGDFEVLIHGREHVEECIERGMGAILVGAHLGSFDVLRVIARDAGIRVNVVMFTANAARINDALRVLDPGCDVRVIRADPTSIWSAFEIRRCIRRGEFVAMLGDRPYPDRRGRVVHASFLGHRAPFPEAPFLLPIVLRTPTILTLALKTGRRRYEVFLEGLAGGEAVARRDRAKVVQQCVDAFAARLEHHCLRAPLQWFNFYDFWADVEPERI